MSNLIQFVGDPFVDAGVAVLEIRIKKPCKNFEHSDLAKQSAELQKIYSQKAWSGYLTVHFPNSCWCNATMGPNRKQQQKKALLRSFDFPQIPERQCVYCRRPAQHIADRSTIPLLTGATTMTSGPGGEPGLPICSACQYAIQFYPLASLKVKGRPLFWWTLHHEWMYELTLDFANRIRQMVEASPEQVPNIGYPSTQLITAVKEVFHKTEGRDLPAIDLIGCHATNYGSGPDYEEIRITKSILEFLKDARSSPVYRAIEAAAWETVKKKTGKKKSLASDESSERTGRNFLFEELGDQFRTDPARPTNILIRYFKPQAAKQVGVFEIACLFARKVLEMTQEQIAAIKQLAEQIANSERAKAYLDSLFQRRGFIDYFRTLTNISDRMARAGEEPIPLKTILDAFDIANENADISNGAIVRELILLRIIETLPKERLQELPDISQEDQTKESEDQD